MDRQTAELLAEDLSLCYDDPLRFVLWAFHWGSRPEMSLVKLPAKWAKRYPNCEYGPDSWACEILDKIGQAVKERKFDGKHAVEPLRYTIASGYGIGKSCITAWLVCWIMATRPNCKGCNAKIKSLKRSAFGFNDWEYLFLKVKSILPGKFSIPIFDSLWGKAIINNRLWSGDWALN